jgi:hypothetical protein
MTETKEYCFIMKAVEYYMLPTDQAIMMFLSFSKLRDEEKYKDDDGDGGKAFFLVGSTSDDVLGIKNRNLVKGMPGAEGGKEGEDPSSQAATPRPKQRARKAANGGEVKAFELSAEEEESLLLDILALRTDKEAKQFVEDQKAIRVNRQKWQFLQQR